MEISRLFVKSNPKGSVTFCASVPAETRLRYAWGISVPDIRQRVVDAASSSKDSEGLFPNGLRCMG